MSSADKRGMESGDERQATAGANWPPVYASEVSSGPRDNYPALLPEMEGVGERASNQVTSDVDVVGDDTAGPLPGGRQVRWGIDCPLRPAH